MNKKKAFDGALAMIISQAIVKVFGLLYKLFLANKDGFGDSGNAIYNSGYQIYALLLVVSSIGVPSAIAKMVSEKYYYGNKKEVAQILKSSLIIFSVIGLTLSLFLAFSAGFIANKVLDMNETKYVLIALSPAIFNVCIISVYRGFYNGTNNINITAKSQSIEQIFKTIFTILLVEVSYIAYNKNTVVMATMANFATTLATLVCICYLNKKNKIYGIGAKFSGKVARRVFKISIPISISAILVSVSKNIDSVTVVRFLKNTIGEQNARIQYGLLSGKVDILASLPVSFIIAAAATLLPIVSSLNTRKDTEKTRYIIKNYLLYTILFVFPCGLVMLGFSDQILKLLFNSSNGGLIFKISAVTMIFISLEQVVHSALHGIGKTYIPSVSLTIGVITKTCLNVVFLRMPYNFFLGGITGVCVATMICHIMAFYISYSALKKNLKIKLNFFKFILKPLICSIIMLMSLNYCYVFLARIIAEKLAIIIATVFAINVYILTLFSFKILSKNELKMVPILSNFINFDKK